MEKTRNETIILLFVKIPITAILLQYAICKTGPDTLVF